MRQLTRTVNDTEWNYTRAFVDEDGTVGRIVMVPEWNKVRYKIWCDWFDGKIMHQRLIDERVLDEDWRERKRLIKEIVKGEWNESYC